MASGQDDPWATGTANLKKLLQEALSWVITSIKLPLSLPVSPNSPFYIIKQKVFVFIFKASHSLSLPLLSSHLVWRCELPTWDWATVVSHSHSCICFSNKCFLALCFLHRKEDLPKSIHKSISAYHSGILIQTADARGMDGQTLEGWMANKTTLTGC